MDATTGSGSPGAASPPERPPRAAEIFGPNRDAAAADGGAAREAARGAARPEEAGFAFRDWAAI